MYRYFSISLLTLLFLFSGCKLFRKGQKEGPQKRMLKEIISKTTKANLDFDNLYLSGRAKLSMPEGDVKHLSVNYRIFMEKDEAILIRINKFIEVARILIRPDSIFALDKINNELHIMPTSSAKEYIGLEADFATLEDILLGNFRYFEGFKLNEVLDLSTNPAVLSGTYNTSSLVYNIDTEINKLLSIFVNDVSRNADASLTYGSFSELGSVKVPNELNIRVSAPQEAGAAFDHKKMKLNQEDFKISFDVPSGYERVNH